MSGLFGTQAEEDYIQISGVKFPLPRNPEGRTEEYETLRTTPLEPFQASTVLGDASLISDDRIAQAVFSDFRPGLGKRRFVAAESLSGYQDADLLTVEGVATLPPYRNTLVNPSGLALQVPTLVYGFTRGQRYQFAVWSPNLTVAAPVKIWDSTGAAFVYPAPGALVGLGVGYCPFARVGRYWVLCAPAGIWYTTDGLNYTQGWTPGGTLSLLGVVRHDNKVYVAVQDSATNGVILRWIATEAQLTAGVGVAWPGVGTDVLLLDSTEKLVNLVDWKDQRNNRQIFVATNRRIVSYDDADFFSEFWKMPDSDNATYPYIFVSPRDDLLYWVAGNRNNSVFVFNHQTVEETGPNKEFGLPKTANGTFSLFWLGGNTRHMFAYGAGQGRVLIANDAFGWSTFARSRLVTPSDLTSAPAALGGNPQGERIMGAGYFESRLYLFLDGGKVEYIDWPDEASSVYNLLTAGSVPDVRAYEAGPAYLYSPEFDAGNELLIKMAKWFILHAENPAAANGPALGLPASCQLLFGYQFDGGAWTTYGTTINSATAFPYTIPLPSLANQQGVPFRKMRFRVALQGAGAGTLTTPILRAVVLAYTREPDIYDGIQVVIDLSEQRFRQLDGQLFYGYDRLSLRKFIEAYKSGPGQAKAHYAVVYSSGGNVKFYVSMDIRVSGTEDPQSGFGHYTLTMRDLSAPPSG